MSPLSEPIEILLVEDSPADVELTQEAFTDCRFPYRIIVARDGQEALETIRGKGKAGSDYRPDLVLLDLNLPKKSGRDVLAAIKGDPSYRRIPVLILSSSRLPSDVLGAYNDHANSYITKPIGIEQLLGMVRSVEDFWMTHAALPPRGTGNA